MKDKLTTFLVLLCLTLTIALGVEHHKLIEVQEQNTRMEKQMKTLSAQVNEITAQWLELVKRVKYHNDVR